MKTKSLTLTAILLFALHIMSCSDDEDFKPITLKDDSRTTITMYYPAVTSGYSYSLEGGDGNYSIQSENNEIVTAEMISSADFRLKAINVGETTVTIEDNSQNKLILNIQVDYESHTYVIKNHDITIIGDDLTTNEKKAIREKYLAEIPVEAGGRYQFIYSDIANKKGDAFIYKSTLGSHRIETTFEFKELEHTNIPGIVSWGHEITINDEKRVLILGVYYPSPQSRRDMLVPMALVEDITQKVQGEYPKAELVFTSQVIDMNPY